MPSLYRTRLVGTGTDRDPYEASGFRDLPHAVLMAQIEKPGVIVYSPRDDIAGTDVVRLITAPDLATLVAMTRLNNPTNQQRRDLNTWCKNGGLTPPTSAEVTWWDCIHFIARQVNPAADLSALTA